MAKTKYCNEIQRGKRGGYTYKITVNNIQEHRACKGCKTRQEALAYVAKRKAELLQNSQPLKDAPTITIGVLGEKYKQYTIARNGDIKHVRSKVKFFNEYFGENTPAVNIKKSDLDPFINYCRTEKGLKDSTIDRYISALSKMYSIAIDDDVLIKNPCSKIGKLALYDQEIYKYWEDDETERLVANVPNKYRDIVEVALFTALRLSNIRLMKKEWIDFDKGLLTVPREKTKSKKPYKFPISADSKLGEILIRNMNNNNNTEYVFINTRRQTPFSADKLEEVFAQACVKAGVNNYGYHGLRHTAGCRLANNGLPIQDIKEFMGHSTIQVTQKYLHNRKGSMVNAMKILEGYTNEAST